MKNLEKYLTAIEIVLEDKLSEADKESILKLVTRACNDATLHEEAKSLKDLALAVLPAIIQTKGAHQISSNIDLSFDYAKEFLEKTL